MAEPTEEQIEQEIKSLRLKTERFKAKQAEMDLEEAEERFQKRKNDKATRVKRNEQNLKELETQNDRRRMKIKRCSHRQGSGIKKDQVEKGGKMASALKGIWLPDERRLVMCSNCPFRLFSPPLADSFTEARKGETEKEAAKRVKAYEAELAEFEKVWDVAQDQLTEEAGQPMDCGLTFEFRDKKGNRAHVPAPCDSYTQGRDNRKDKAA